MAFAVIEHFCSRLFLVFSGFFFTVEFKKERNLLNEPGMSRRSLWILPTIHDACLNTTLMAIRDIDDFLTPRMGGSRKDDLKASDLGFKEGLGFLGKTERERINKLIMHSTKVAAYGNQEPLVGYWGTHLKMRFQKSLLFEVGAGELQISKASESLGSGSFLHHANRSSSGVCQEGQGKQYWLSGAFVPASSELASGIA